MKRWYNEFNRGRHLLTDKFRKDRSKSVVGTENINAVQKLMMQVRHVRRLEQKESKYCCHRKVKHKNDWRKGRLIFRGKAEQNKVGSKERQIFFTGEAK